MALTHENCSVESREFCDQLLSGLKRINSQVIRASSSTCAFALPGTNRFAHLYHKRNTLVATIYLRGDAPALIPGLSNRVSFQPREKAGTKWAEEFPTLIHIPIGSSATEVAERLMVFSLPLAGKKQRTRKAPPRLNDVIETEGKVFTVLSTRYERDPKLRARCLDHFGYRCRGCGLMLAERYGAIAEKLIHVHHLERLADTGERAIDPLKDLVPLCPNCHAVVHLKTPPITLDQLRNLIKFK